MAEKILQLASGSSIKNLMVSDAVSTVEYIFSHIASTEDTVDSMKVSIQDWVSIKIDETAASGWKDNAESIVPG
jgi:hypothetical protein